MKHAHNLYFHVPFCRTRCNYCAFFSAACANPDWDGYCEKILNEIDHWHKRLGRIPVPTVFFGGGTPSLMPIDIFKRIMTAVNDKFELAGDAEITIESNPGTLDAAKLAEFKRHGVNRLSVGVQSLNDDELKFLGRTHDVAAAVQLLRDAAAMGLNTSGDFIYGLPGQTASDIENMCHKINELGLDHCSMYELSIEDNTPFAKMNLNMPGNDTMAEMYDVIAKTLHLARYEVSNYANPGHECRHNQNIWDGDAYIGIGPGAAGRVFVDGAWYDQMGNGQQFEKLSNATRAIENIIMGLRTTRGVKLSNDVRSLVDWQYIEQNPDLFNTSDDKIAVTEKGMLILNDLLLYLIK